MGFQLPKPKIKQHPVVLPITATSIAGASGQPTLKVLPVTLPVQPEAILVLPETICFVRFGKLLQ